MVNWLCCEACQLGIISASMSVDCSNQNINLGCPWNSAYEACLSEKNICQLYPGELCAQICEPTPGSYVCQCYDGFTLMADGKTCQQNTIQDRCTINNPCQHKCHDTGVSIECSCNKGYRLHSDNKSCIDIDECSEGLHYCKSHETCHNEPGSFYCEQIRNLEVPQNPVTNAPSRAVLSTVTIRQDETKSCAFGYTFNEDKQQCVDVNECIENIHVCQRGTEDCVNLEGGYKCIKIKQEHNCKTGFRWNSTIASCLDVNECDEVSGDSPCDSNQVCENTVGSYRCLCKTGYQLDSLTQACVDINECQVELHNCLLSQRCDNTIGSFQCIRHTNCGTGYTLNAQTGMCEDDDECLLKIDNCQVIGPDFVCRNTLGSFRCERKSKDDCNGKCTTSRAIVKTCPRGYQPNSSGQCEDVNECEKGLARCGPNQRCTNIQGAYICSAVVNCDAGFRINEAKTKCIDIDECAEQKRICDHLCFNMWGTYRCSCQPGYKLHDDNRTCIDLNECEIFKDRRLCTGYCVNQPGSYSCQCPQGYNLGNDGASCQDIDECKTGSFCTGQDEACLNMRGSYRCNSLACPPGYIKDSQHQNRCKKATMICREQDVECIQQPLMYTFYFIALVSNYTIPPGGLDLFTMKGPYRPTTTVDFSLSLKMANSAPGIPPATDNYFLLSPSGHNQAGIKLIQTLLGPQDIQLQLTMSFYHNNIYGGKTVSKIGLFVSQYEF
ncbi:uncharacterized protein LOC142322595 [Lycorma delicatula]|uniref:uncharacterized protein LOC142322595 n=1 Tax=Lycorma delicatula TaxID=130591 RepID=UPI003F50E616